MSDKLDTLQAHRDLLSAEIALHRLEIARAAQALHKPLRKVDRIREDVRFFRERYLFLLLPVAVLVALNPVRTLKLVAGAVSLWRAFDRARGPRELRATQALAETAAARRRR